jgi:hypothetical protein
MAKEPGDMDIQMDISDLYREELFTDRRVGTIQRLMPVDRHGEPDPGRPIRFLGQAQIYTPGGPLPLNFEIQAANLEQAVKNFGPAAEQAVEDTMRKLEEMRREAASSIVVPGAGGSMGGPGGPAGLPGGGKIQLR